MKNFNILEYLEECKKDKFPSNLDSKDGHLSFAFNLGYNLTKFNLNEINSVFGILYTTYVDMCKNKPLIDAVEFYNSVAKGMELFDSGYNKFCLNMMSKHADYYEF